VQLSCVEGATILCNYLACCRCNAVRNQQHASSLGANSLSPTGLSLRACACVGVGVGVGVCLCLFVSLCVCVCVCLFASVCVFPRESLPALPANNGCKESATSGRYREGEEEEERPVLHVTSRLGNLVLHVEMRQLYSLRHLPPHDPSDT
jgi:hypothetical protein